MGYYIETTQVKDKAQWLIDHYNAIELEKPEFNVGEYTTICVIDNGAFEAAAIIYSKDELYAFNDPRDFRDRRWLKMKATDVVKLCPAVANRLEIPVST